jgi:hypothetical protein
MIDTAKWMDEPGQQATTLTVPGMGKRDAGREQ